MLLHAVVPHDSIYELNCFPESGFNPSACNKQNLFDGVFQGIPIVLLHLSMVDLVFQCIHLYSWFHWDLAVAVVVAVAVAVAVF